MHALTHFVIFGKCYFTCILGKVMFGKATVTLSDVTAGNGVVHAIDEVLFTTPPTSNIGNSVESTKNDNSINFSAKKKNLVELCKDLGFTSFAAAMAMTGIDKVDHFNSKT